MCGMGVCWPVWLEELQGRRRPPSHLVARTVCSPPVDRRGAMASGAGTSAPVGAGQNFEVMPVLQTTIVLGGRSGPGPGRSTASAGGVAMSEAGSGLGNSTRAVELLGQPTSVRQWAGRCCHCHRGLKVTVKKWADGRDKCRVTPYEPSPSDRSRSRSPPPVISPVRSGSGGEGRGGEHTLLHGASGLADRLAEGSLPDGDDTRLLSFFGEQ